MAERKRQGRPRPPRVSLADVEQRDLQLWTHRIRLARKLRMDWAQKYKVDMLAQTFNGDMAGLVAPDSDDLPVVINRFWPTVKAQLPGLLWQNPKFFVRPDGRRALSVGYQQAAASEALLSHIAQQDDHFIQEAKLALQQSFWAIGVLKCVYDPHLEPNPQRGQPMWVLDADAQPLRDPLTGQLAPLMDPETGEAMREPARVLNDEVYRWQWVHWSNMLLPDDGPALLRWRWIGEEIEVPLTDAQEDTRFPKALREQLRHTERPLAEGMSRMAMAPAVNEQDQRVWYTECWDMARKRHYVLAEGQAFSATHFLLEDDLPDGVEDHPYAILPGYTPLTDPEPSPWPVPHCWNWLGLQQEYSQRREQMMNAARRSARKYFYDQSTFPDIDEATAAMDSNRDMEGVLIMDINRPPLALPDPGSPPDIARDLALLEKDWMNATGMPGERMGNASSETATQAVISDRAAAMREGEMKNVVTLWLTTAGKKMLQLLKATLTLEQWVKIRDWTDSDIQQWVGKNYGREGAALLQVPGMRQQLVARYGQERWTAVSREMLQFEAAVGVQPGSGRSRTAEQDKQQALLFMRTLAEIGGVMPALLTSRRFLVHMAELFELHDDLLVDELLASVKQQMAQAQQAEAAKSAGRGMPAGPSPTQVEGQPMASRLQSAMLNGGF